MNLSFSKQINEGDTIVVSLCSYYTEIASLIGSDHYFELINIDIVRENGQSVVPMSALVISAGLWSKYWMTHRMQLPIISVTMLLRFPACGKGGISHARVTGTDFSSCSFRNSLKTQKTNGKTGKS